MKSTVNSVVLISLLVLIIYPLPLVHAENSCQCENPPGGQIKCEDGQTAICRIIDGKVQGQCLTPPKESSHGLALRAWVLSQVLRTKIEPRDIETKKELQQILAEGRYVDPKTREIVTFKLPKER